MKLSVIQYFNESMPDTKFESGSFSSFGDMMSKIFPLKRGQVIKFRYLSTENGFNLEKNEFLCPDLFFRPKIDLPSQFQQL